MSNEYDQKLEDASANVIILEPPKEVLDTTLKNQKQVIQIALLTPEE